MSALVDTLIDNLINDNLVPLKPYESARRLYSGGQDWLNANESPYANEYTCLLYTSPSPRDRG